jgi:hypothetical protein
VETWEFGRMLRRWRDRVAPATVGVPAGGRRRATGLRREELAGLAGISADYLTYRLAGHAAPGRDVVPSRITASVQRLLDRLANTPVAVYDATWTLLVANAPYDALMGETSTLRGIERNAIWRHLVGPGTRAVQTPEEHADLEAGLVADLRLSAARYPADRTLTRLVKELSARSPRFVELWESSAPDPRQEQSRHKIIDHPAVGRITLDCDILVVAADDVRIMVFTAEPGTEDAERLALAVVLGTQTLVEQ